jgi:hypothetical protein
VIRLNTLLKRSGNKLTYLYDFGDSWEHEIVLEDKNFSLDEMQPIECIEGIMACPPEDCGGAHAYMHLLRAVFDPQNNEEDYEAFWKLLVWMRIFRLVMSKALYFNMILTPSTYF